MMRPRHIPFWPAAVAFAAAAIVFAVLLFGLLKARSDQAVQVAKLETENRVLRAQSENLSRELNALREGVPMPHTEERPIEPAGRLPSVDAVEQAKQLIQFREKLASANKSIEALQVRIQELEATIEKTVEDNKRLAASEADLKEKVAATNHVVEAVQTELRGKDDRLTQLEAANRRLREDSRATSDKVAQIPKLLRDLEEINRRREGYLTGILRRYRDLTDQYRAMASRLDSPRENTLPGTAELGAIQNTISMTEEDLRQLASLNAQAVRIQQKVSGK